MEQITLYFKQGSSDKIYQARIAQQDGGYVVAFAYGRRGTTLQTGAKTQTPVSYDAAKVIYDNLLKEKIAKGYTPGENGTPYHDSGNGNEHSGINCQLLNAVDESEVAELLGNRTHAMQQKFDGRRLLVQRIGETVTGINRLGLKCGIPATIEQSAKAFPVDFIIDGEAVGDVVHAFDLLGIDGKDIRGWRSQDRYLQLMNLIASGQQQAIKLVETAFLPRHKKALFEQMKAEGREGVVFKQNDAVYTTGRPASGGTQLKYKFVETASFIVNRINGKRSVSLMLFDGEKVVGAGNVTIPPNHEIPIVGAVVEVRYLYAFAESGCIFQPVYLGRREDITTEECVVTQLKFKAQAEEAA